MRRTPWLAVFLAVLGLVACASGPETEPENGEPAPAEGAAAPKKPKNLLAEGERSQLYFDLDQYTGRYMAARDEGNSRAWMSLHASVLMPMVERNLTELLTMAGNDGEPRYQIIAIRALGFGSSRSSPRIVPVLNDLLEKQEVKVVNSSLVSLYMLGWADTPLPRIVKHLNSPDTLVRSNAALALSRIVRNHREEVGERFLMTPVLKEASGRLMAMAHRPEEDPFVRAHAAAAIGSIADPAAADVLSNLMIDEFLVVRVRAAQALGDLGQESAIVPLIDALGVSETRAEARIIVASLEKIALSLDYPVDKQALGLEADNWKAWYAAVKAGK